MSRKSNVILIGMPGSGKSTAGVVLAKMLGCGFVDVDLIITKQYQKPLQAVLDEAGLEEFLRIEGRAGETLVCENCVVSTGGSMVLSPAAMASLGENGTIVFLDVPLEELERRITNVHTRGIAMRPNETLAAVYAARRPLYLRYGDLVVPCEKGDTLERMVAKIMEGLETL